MVEQSESLCVCVCVFMASRCTPRSVVGTASFKRLDGVKTYTKIYLSLLKTNLEFSGFFFRHILIVRLLSGVLFLRRPELFSKVTSMPSTPQFWPLISIDIGGVR